jgi:hypothetical protein
MNTSPPDHEYESEPSGFDSLDCVNVIDDGPGDTTVRPAHGVLLQLALAERERMARWQALMDQQPPENLPKEDGTRKENPS